MLFQPDFDEVTVQDGGESEEETHLAEEPEPKEYRWILKLITIKRASLGN